MKLCKIPIIMALFVALLMCIGFNSDDAEKAKKDTEITQNNDIMADVAPALVAVEVTDAEAVYSNHADHSGASVDVDHHINGIDFDIASDITGESDGRSPGYILAVTSKPHHSTHDKLRHITYEESGGAAYSQSTPRVLLSKWPLG